MLCGLVHRLQDSLVTRSFAFLPTRILLSTATAKRSSSDESLAGIVARRANSDGESNQTRRAAMGDFADAAEGALKAAGTVFLAIAAFYTGAKISVIGQPRKPPLEGNYKAIGSQVVQIAGLRCRVFYPSGTQGLNGAPAVEAPYLTEGTGTSDAMARLVFFPGFLLEHLGAASSGCLLDPAPLLPGASDQKYPVLVYSHGQGGNMDMGTYFLREIASFGVVVVSVEHQDGSASTADAKNPRPFNLLKGQLGTRARAMECVAVADALRVASGETSAARWGGDINGLLVGGHSYGGPTALTAAADRPDLFCGVVLHDPATTSSPRPVQPVFSIVADQYAGITSLADEVKRVSTGQVSSEAVQRYPGFAWAGAWHYEGISHGNFVDAPLWAPLIIMRLLGLILIPAAGPEEPAEAHARMAESAAAFSRSCCSAIRGAPRTEDTLRLQPALPLKRL